VRVHGRHRDTATSQRIGELDRIAHTPEHLGCVAPQGTAFAERPHGVRIILEAREVDDGVVRNLARGADDGGRRIGHTEIAWQRQGADGRVMIEIGEPVESDDVETGAGGRIRRGARREPGDENTRRFRVLVQFCIPNRRRAASGVTT
jgi:hypothetical protein